MDNVYVFNDINYVVLKDDFNIFDYDELKEMVTSYFNDFDYIFGDMAYNKIRLKGLCDKKNKNYKDFNAIENLDSYIKDYCAYGCKWFVLKKMQ